MIERTVGTKYPISLGTAMIFEQPEFDMEKWPNYLYVNLRTLYRNYVASIPRERYHQVKQNEFCQAFLDEVSHFEAIVKELSNNRISIYFFLPSWKSLNHLLPKIDRKDYNPEAFDVIEENMWKYLKSKGVMIPFNYQQVDSELPGNKYPTLLLSSFVVDLLSFTKFPKLLLLESYTGKIKRREEWFTKVNLGKGKNTEGVSIPFNKFTIQIFGDKSGMFKVRDKNLRILVRDMAKREHWTPLTTNDKIKYCIGKLKDYKIKETLMSYL